MVIKDNNGGNIQTHLRIRPTKRISHFLELQSNNHDNQLEFNVPPDLAKDYVNNTRSNYKFAFDSVIHMDASQDMVFNTIGKDAVDNALQGYNSTIFAYGQTGSGKTFSITGGPEKYSDRGIIPRSISMIFNEFKKRNDMKYQVYISYLEIYNSKGLDLLNENHDMNNGNMPLDGDELRKVNMMEDEDGNIHLKNLSLNLASTEEEALNYLFMGDTNRAISETAMNQTSSRSHCIFTISLEGRRVGSDKVLRSKLNLVDLAGSERVHKTNATGRTLSEAKNINGSLFHLEMVIKALHEKSQGKRTHIPYRNSMMTSVLRDSLGGNCKTIMLATISAEQEQTEESISTCRFAQRVGQIKNDAFVNEDLDPSQVIKRLKTEVNVLKEEITFLKGESGEGDDLTEEDRAMLINACHEYINSSDSSAKLDIGTMSLTKLTDCFALFKKLVLEARENGGGEGGSCSFEGGVIPANAEKHIKSLQAAIKQRDNEIAILVNMVKQGKSFTVGNMGGGSGGSSSSSGGIDFSSAAARSQPKDMRALFGTSDDNNNNYKPGNEEESKWADAKGAYTKSGNKNQNQNTKNYERSAPKLSKKELLLRALNIPKPDSSQLEDPEVAFKYFRKYYPSKDDDNKKILKEKYEEAKKMGERVNRARTTINYLKNTIEQIRREKAMEGLVDRHDTENENKDSEEDDEGVKTHKLAIEREKKLYRESFDKLREFKAEIENIQRLLEKNRVKMQADFDTWYDAILTNEDDTVSCKSDDITVPEVYKKVEHNRNYQQPNVEQRTPRKSGGGLSLKDQLKQSLSSNSSTLRGFTEKQPGAGRVSSGAEHMTGNKDADEDIMAFYRAKEELLQFKK